MKHLLKMSLRYLREQKLRTLLTWCCITVAAVMLCTFCMAGSTLYQTIRNYVTVSEGTFEASVPVDLFDDATQETYRIDPDVLENSALVEDAVVVQRQKYGAYGSEPETEDVTHIARTLLTLNGVSKQTALSLIQYDPALMQMDPGCMEMFFSNQLQEEIEGRFPTQPGEIMLPFGYDIAEKETGFGGCKLGDTISLSVTPQTYVLPMAWDDAMTYLNDHPDAAPTEQGECLTATYTVVGFCDEFDTLITYVDDPQLEALFEPLCVSLRIKEGLDFDDALEQLLADAGARNPGTDARYEVRKNSMLLTLELRSADKVVSMLPSLAMLAIVAMLILIIARLIIDNAFEMSTQERVRQFGILRTVGASRGQVFAIIAFEALFYALVTIPVALLLTRVTGMAAIRSLSEIAPRISDNLPAAFQVNDDFFILRILQYQFYLPFVVASVLLCCVAIFISAYTSAMKATRFSPIEALSFGRPSAAKNGAAPRKSSKAPARSRHRLGFVPFYIHKNKKRDKKRNRITTFSAALGIFLFVFFTSGVFIVKERLNYEMDGSMSISVQYYKPFQAYTDTEAPSCTPAEAAREIQAIRDTGYFTDCVVNNTEFLNQIPRNLDERAYAPFYTDAFQKTANKKGVRRIKTLLVPVDRFTYADYFEAQTGMDYDSWCAAGTALLGEQMLLIETTNFTEKTYQLQAFDGDISCDLQVNLQGDLLPVRGSIDNRELPGTMRSCWNSQVCVFAPLEYAWSLSTGETRNSFFLSLTPREERYEESLAWLETYREKAQRETGLQISCYDHYESMRSASALLDAIVRLVYYLIGLVLAINLFNIMNTVHTSVLNRRRELAMLRAVGMSHGQLCRSVLLDAARYMLIATVLSGLLALVGMGLLLPAVGLYTDRWLEDVLLCTLAATGFSLVSALIAALPSLLQLKKASIMSVIREIE